jgi:hypothetical protein
MYLEEMKLSYHFYYLFAKQVLKASVLALSCDSNLPKLRLGQYYHPLSSLLTLQEDTGNAPFTAASYPAMSISHRFVFSGCKRVTAWSDFGYKSHTFVDFMLWLSCLTLLV